MKLNDKGMTLVELLAALALVSTIAVIAWTTLTIGFKHTTVENNKTHLQQDANLIITSLSNAHRRNDAYSLKFENGQLMIQPCPDITTCDPLTDPYEQVIEKNYDFNGTVINGILYNGGSFAPIPVEPKKKNTQLTLSIKELNNSVTIETTLSRIITSLK